LTAVPSGGRVAACIDPGNTRIETNNIDINSKGRVIGDEYFLGSSTRLATIFFITTSRL
jgi:hypothetical protein